MLAPSLLLLDGSDWIVTGVEVSTLRRSVEVLPSWLRTWLPLLSMWVEMKTGNGSGGRVSDGYLVSASFGLF